MEQAYEIIGVFLLKFQFVSIVTDDCVCVGYCLFQKPHQFWIVKQFIQAEPLYQKGDNKFIEI